MASRSQPERRPLRRAARFVARLLPPALLPRSLRPGLTGSARRPPGPSVGAGVTGTFRVRAPWSLLRWYEGLRRHASASASPDQPLMRPGGRPGSVPGHRPGLSSAAGSHRGLSLATGSHRSLSSAAGPHRGLSNAAGSHRGLSAGAGSHRGLSSAAGPDSGLRPAGRLLGAARDPLTTRGSLIAVPPAGPDVRPGHDLTMAPGIAALRPSARSTTTPHSGTATRRATAAPASSIAASPIAGSSLAGGSPAGASSRGIAPSGASPRGDSAAGTSAPDVRGAGASSRAVPALGPPAPGISTSGAAVPGVGLSASDLLAAGISGTSAARIGADRLAGVGPVARAAGASGPTVHGDGLPGMAGFGPGGYGLASLSRRFTAGAPHLAGPSAHVSTPPASASSPPGFPPGQFGRRGGGALHSEAVRPGGGSLPAGRPADSLAAQPVSGPVVSDPDGAGSLRVLGAASLPPGNVPDPAGAVTIEPAARGWAGPVPRSRTPRERWETAVAARPLEAPRQLPAAFHAMASAITGRARPPLFTTGPNTRHALAAAGALGATTGTVVHLPAAPSSGPAVSAVLAHELTHTKSPVRRPRFLLDGASALLDDDERQALAAGREGLGQATGAGIVDSLPVGGGGMGAVSEMATRAARAAVLEASGSPMGNAFSGLQGMAGSAISGGQGAVSGMPAAAAGAVDDAVAGASSAVSEAAGVSNAAGGTTGGTGAAGPGAKPLDPDQVIEIVERRLLREIERRGGRWAGIF